jgi:flagellar biosynthesis/type III secretory pathway chaperone
MATMIEELEHVMQSEVEIGESLLQVMMQKQRSIVGLQGDGLSTLVAQEEEMIRPFQQLEERRVRLTAALTGRPASGEPGTTIPLAELLSHLTPSDALRISTMSTRLRTVSERIIHMNDQNRILLQRSVRFVQETLRLVTDDHTRQLVDHRV